MNLKQVKYLIYALAVAAFLTAMAAYGFHSAGLWVAAAVVCGVIVAAGRVLWRCPHCGAHLGRVDDAPKFCRSCGHKLEDFQ